MKVHAQDWGVSGNILGLGKLLPRVDIEGGISIVATIHHEIKDVINDDARQEHPVIKGLIDRV